MLTDVEIKILEKTLDFAPMQLQINDPELNQDFKDLQKPAFIFGTSGKISVKLQHFQQNLAKTLPEDTPG